MKKLLGILLVVALLCVGAYAFGEETVTLKEWLDSKGETNGQLIVCVTEIINPVLANVQDETAEIHLFGVMVDGEFADFITADIQAGDVLLISQPKYNEFEGNIELAESVLVRKLTALRRTEEAAE